MPVGAVQTRSRPSAASQAPRPPAGELRRGHRGPAVQELQKCLMKLGLLSRADYQTGPGIFGPHTELALRNFQARNRCVVDGWYGSQSRAAMQRALGQTPAAPPAPTSHPSQPGPAEPPANYQRVTSHGVTMNVRTRAMLQQAETYARRMGVPVPFSISQGSYHRGYGPSAGTHDGGGALDLRVGGLSRATQLKFVKALRMAGFAAWSRGHYDGFAPHIHAVAIGDREASATAKGQVREYFRGGDGLVGSHPDYDAAAGRPYPAWARRFA